MSTEGSVYILQSQITGRLYIGSTRNVSLRLKAHNAGRVRSTKAGKPYLLIHSESFDTYTEARKREHFLKSGVGRKSLALRTFFSMTYVL